MKKGVYFIIFLLLIGIMGAWAYRNSDMEQDISAAAVQISPGEPYETLSCPVPVSAYLFRDIDSIDLQLENGADLEWLAGLLDGTEISYVGETFTKSSETPPLYLVMPYENGDSLHITINDANQIMIADNSVIDGQSIGCPPAGAYSLDTDSLFQEIFDIYESIKHDEAHNALLANTSTNMLTAEASSDEAIIFNLMEAFFQKYMDGQVSLTHPDFSDIVIDNANTQLYSAMINYDIDTNEVYGTVIDDYDLTVEVENMNIQDKFASAEVRFCSVHHYAHLGERQTSAWKIPFYFEFVKTGTDWKIEHIDGQDYRFKNLEELNSPEMQSLYENQTPQDILSKKLEDLRNSDLNLLLYGDENSEESQNKIADAQVRTSSVS